MSGDVFVDSNVLVYARDASEPEKQRRAAAWMEHLWRSRSGRLSFQVLQEFYTTVTDRLQPGLETSVARSDVRDLMAWSPLHVDARVIEGAWGLQDRFGLAWWDAQIVAAAQLVACRWLLTEDLQHGQRFGDLGVVDPFRTAPGELGSGG